MASKKTAPPTPPTPPSSASSKAGGGQAAAQTLPGAVEFDPSSFSVTSIASQAAARPDGQTKFALPGSLATKASGPYALGLVLEEAGVINKEMVSELVPNHEAAQSVRRSLIQQDIVNEEDMLNAHAEELGMGRIELADVEVTPELLDLIDPAFAKKHRVFPVSVSDDELVIALSDPTNISASDDLQNMTGKTVRCMIASEEEIERHIRKFYEGEAIDEIYKEFTDESDDPFGTNLEKYETIDLDDQDHNLPPVVRFVDLIFAEAVNVGSSDIHIEPTRTGLNIRFRIDGVLQQLPSPPRRWQNMIVSRLKVMSGMDLAEKRVPQDGRIKLTLPDKSLDLRVSSMPSIFGETIVMRILDQSDVLMGLEDVGFLPDSINMFKKLIKAPNGVILMTGPTGSGKTTTLNSALSTLNDTETKIITAEDPVEYQIQGINQIQINTEADLTFSVALRAMLRMSPDVIMVGEIRDMETAEIAIRAALTGHLVFSTLHTNDAPSSTIRLIDMGLKPFLVASSIQAVIAQRLIRRICSNCKTEFRPPPEALRDAGIAETDAGDARFFKGSGCDRCNDTGYRGRTAIHEIFVMDSELRKMVIRAESNIKIKKTAIAHGMRTLRHDGLEKVKLGMTTLEEVMRITQLD